MPVMMLAAAAALASTSSPIATACRSLNGFRAGDLVVTQAEMVPVGPAPKPPMSPNGMSNEPQPTLPEHCRVVAEVGSRKGADGQSYAVRLEVRGPTAWNGRLLQQGGGGLDGMLLPAVGTKVLTSAETVPPALARGFAVVTTDSGHQGRNFDDVSFAKDQQAKLDYGYAAIGKVAEGARAIVERIYGRKPDHNYFAGCSNGGREAMMAAQRFPTKFDGILAADPAFNLDHAAVLSNFSGSAYSQAAKIFNADSAHLFTPEDAKLIQTSLLTACDDLDGAKDGMIFDHAACRFDVAKLRCRKDQTAGCLAPAKVDAIVTAFRGPRDANGAPIAGSWTMDAGDFTPDWLLWQTGLPLPTGSLMFLRDLVASSLTQYFAYPPYKQPLVGGDEEARTLLELSKDTASFTDAKSTQLSTFRARGGRMMIVTGWSDPVFSATDLIGYFDRLTKDQHAVDGTAVTDYARLFLIPGMTHCGGGAGLDDYDALSSLVAWVEKGQAPSSFVARGKAFPGVSRPICSYPAIARYDGHGAIADAASFNCAPPGPGA